MWVDKAEHIFDQILTDEEAPARLFGMMDVNGDGVVDKQEFVAQLSVSSSAILMPIVETWRAGFRRALSSPEINHGESVCMMAVKAMQNRLSGSGPSGLTELYRPHYLHYLDSRP